MKNNLNYKFLNCLSKKCFLTLLKENLCNKTNFLIFYDIVVASEDGGSYFITADHEVTSVLMCLTERNVNRNLASSMPGIRVTCHERTTSIVNLEILPNGRQNVHHKKCRRQPSL